MSERPKATILGAWVLENGKVVGDQATRIIRHLIANHFIEVSEREGGWTTLHQDPTDGSCDEVTEEAIGELLVPWREQFPFRRLAVCHPGGE